MARAPRGLDAPRGRSSMPMRGRPSQPSRDRFGRATEWIARNMGTPWFLVALTVFCLAWITWNVTAPPNLRFDSVENGFVALTLMLSLQASYAAPLILLAQNRQDDRDRVQIEQDRQRSERNLADTEYLAREIVALRIALTEISNEVVTRDALRAELKSLITKLDERQGTATTGEGTDHRPARRDQP